MSVDVLLLNTAVMDIRSREFQFADKLVGPGGLAKCRTEDMPDFPQDKYEQWIQQGCVTAGGPGNTAPLIARAGLEVAVGVNLGKGNYDGLDAQGRYFYDTMVENNVDMSQTCTDESLPTGTTYIYDKPGSERGGIAYFPNANNNFDFEYFKESVEKLQPKIVYYMYSGLSDRGDANGGRDLADFMHWCRQQGSITIADSHTLTGNPLELIRSGQPVEEYKLLEPLLKELDLFFTSSDEAQMIENTLAQPLDWSKNSEQKNIEKFLDFLAQRFWKDRSRSRMFGVTVSNGAWQVNISGSSKKSTAKKTVSKFMFGQVIDLVGAGDSFRAGFISYIAKNIDAFKNGTCNYQDAIQMGNLFACLYIKADLKDRYGNITDYEKMSGVVERPDVYQGLDQLINAIK